MLVASFLQRRFRLEWRVRSRRQLRLDLAAHLRRRISRRRVGAQLYRKTQARHQIPIAQQPLAARFKGFARTNRKIVIESYNRGALPPEITLYVIYIGQLAFLAIRRGTTAIAPYRTPHFFV
jgi:hypothetical protein